MKYFNQNDAFLVRVDKEDIEQFNKEEPARLPGTRFIIFGFRKGSGDMIRLEPDSIRKGGTAWERLRDEARAFGMKRVRYEASV